MSDYSPPTEDLPIFDVNVFNSGDEPLTYNQAKKKFLRYPTAQGKETLQAVDVNGIATFKDNIVQQGVKTITQSDNTVNSSPNTLRPTHIYGDLTIYRPSTQQGGAFRAFDVGNSTSGYSMQLFQSGLTTNIRDLAPNGTILLAADNSSSVIKTLYSSNASTGTIIQTDKTDSTTNPQLKIVDTSSTKMIGLYANTNAQDINPMTNVNNSIIYANTTSDSLNTETLLLTTRGNQTTGVRINPTSIMIGTGGTASDPSVRMNFNNSIISVTGPMGITHNSTTVPCLSLTYNGTGYPTGLSMVNCALVQSGGGIGSIVNVFGSSNVAAGCSFNILTNSALTFNTTNVTQYYKMSSDSTTNFKLYHFNTSTGVTDLITTSTNTEIKMNVKTTAQYTMPASNDSTTTIPSTAWVQGAISAATSTFTPNSVTITPTSNALMYSSGVYNQYNIGGRFAFNSSTTSAFLNVCAQPLNINIVNQSGQAYQDPTTGAIIYNPLVGPIIVRVSCMAWNGSNSGQAIFDLVINQQACFGVNNNASNSYNNWGRYQDNTTTSTNNLNYTITNNWITQGSTVATGYIVTGLSQMATFGRQVWAYGQSISLPTLYAGMNKVSSSHAQIKLWFGGWASGGNNWYVTAEILSDVGAKSGTVPAGYLSGVYLS